jgi:hypothetical protein
MQGVHHMTSVMADQAAPPRIVVRVTRVAVVRDRLVSAGGVFVGNHVRVEQSHAHRAAGADAIAPAETQVGLVGSRLEAPARCYRHVPMLSTDAGSDFPIFNVIASAAVAVDASPKFLAAGSRLHRSSADFAVSNVPDA